MLPELERSRMHSRVKGRPALVRRIRSLLIAVHRYARGRHCTRADQRWAARVIDGLTVLLQEGSADAHQDV